MIQGIDLKPNTTLPNEPPHACNPLHFPHTFYLYNKVSTGFFVFFGRPKLRFVKIDMGLIFWVQFKISVFQI